MGKYKIVFKKSITKDLKALPKADVIKVLTKIDSLAENPRQDGAIKLSGHALYRVRQGLYRVIYEIRDDELVIQVIKVGHRSDI